MSLDLSLRGQKMEEYLKLKQTVDQYRHLKSLLSVVRKGEEGESGSDTAESRPAARRARLSTKKRYKW